MTLTTRLVAVLTAIALSIPLAHGEMLTGASAQGCAQADVLLAYESALITGGLEAASTYMTPSKLEELRGMKEAFGEEGFNEFLERIRVGAQGEERRRQIETVDVTGEHAVLEARDDAHTVTVQHFTETAQGWKVDVKP